HGAHDTPGVPTCPLGLRRRARRRARARDLGAAKMETWFQGRLGFPVRLPSVARRLIGGRVSSVADAPVAYALYDRSSQSISLFVTRRVPFARRGWTERHVDGAELYFASLRGVALIWWEEKRADRIYAAVSAGDENALVEFALLCIKGGQSR